MDNKKHEWYGLAPAQREKIVLELLAQGYTADMLNEYFDVKTKRVINDFMNSEVIEKKIIHIYLSNNQRIYQLLQ